MAEDGGESQWASWKDRGPPGEKSATGDRRSHSSRDSKGFEADGSHGTERKAARWDSEGQSSDSKVRSGPPKGRGYQESRRYDRERRGKRNDKRTDDKMAASKDETARPSVSCGSSDAKSNEPKKTAEGKSHDRTQALKSSSEPRTRREDTRDKGHGRRGDQGTTDSRKAHDRDRDAINKSSRKAANKNQENGADLLNLLHTPSKEMRGADSGSGKSPVKSKPVKEVKSKGKSASDLEAQWQKEEEERKRKEEEQRKKEAEQRKREEEQRRREEEERRREEEKLRLEEERKQREAAEAQRLKEEEMKSISDFIQETAEKIQWKNELREKNLKAGENRPDEAFFSKLDSSLKKNTAFVKKLRNITESQKESLTKDFNALNLSKYIGEAAVAVTEAKLKMTDINCAVHICSLLHQRYGDFSNTLMENWSKVLLNKKDEKVPNPSKLRVDLRFFADLVAVGVFSQKEGLPVLANQLMLLINNDKEEHNNLTIILSFSKHCGDDYAGLLPRKYKLLAAKYECEIPRSTLLVAERQKACRNLLHDYFTSLCKHLTKEHAELKQIEKQNRKILQTKGELNSERKEKQESAFQSFQKLLLNAQSLADVLDDELPELPEEAEYKADSDQMGCDVYHPSKAEFEYSGDSALFEDEDTRQFYENIPDLKAVIPGILYKDSEQAVTSDTQESEMALEEDYQDLDVEELEKALKLGMEGQTSELPDAVSDTQSSGPAGPQKDDKKQTTSVTDKKGEELMIEDIEPEVALDGEDDDADVASSMKLMLDAFLNSLPNCVNRELIDRSATDFCMNLNTKVNRKKLVRTLFTVQRTRYDLLPFYSRFVATLHPCMPDVAADLGTLLKSDFKWHVRKKDQINIESKLKTVRFLGELVKFKMFPKAEILHCLKMLMFDFSHHNIEMACAILETCGRFLYRSPDSHHRTKVYLDVMMRKKAALHFDQRYDTMIENAYYYSNPPDVKQEAKKVRPPIHEYIRKLLYKDLSKITTEKVLRQMRKLTWANEEVKFYVTKCLVAIWNVRYNSIHCCANLLAGLASYHEDVAISVVDGVLEDIRLGMEINVPKFNQRRVSGVKFLGELYNYRMVESGVIFKTLYSFITFGVSLDENVLSPLDPPEHLFRIRVTCVLLDTCGQYFDRGSSKRKLDYFLTYFLRYYFYKRKFPMWNSEHPFPMDIDYTVKDTIEAIRPKLKLPESYEEAATAVEETEKELRSKLAEVLPQFKNPEVGEGDAEQDGVLETIQETDEIDEMSQGLSQVQITDDTQESDDEREEGTGSQTLSQSRQLHRADDEGEEGEGQQEVEEHSDSEDLIESAGEDEAEDQVTVLNGGLKPISCQEDDDFMAAFDKMLTDTIQARNQEAVKVPQVEITMPVNIKVQQKAKPPVVNFLEVKSEEEVEEEEEEDDDDIMKFTLMTRKGNKPQFTSLNIPVSENFASKFKEREEAKKAEKERMKRVVLDIHERQEEEDYQEMIASMNRPAMVNFNRERRVRYQHPKGAPDADLIFGSKKR